MQRLEEEHEFSLKAYAISKGTCSHMWEVTPQQFEHGQDVIDRETGKQGQVRFTVWSPKLEGWLYCISRKDIDDPTKYVAEARLIKAPAQTRLDTRKTILYAPKKLKHQQRPSPYFRKDRGRAAWRWDSRRLEEFKDKK